jgi:hypothetical protein
MKRGAAHHYAAFFSWLLRKPARRAALRAVAHPSLPRNRSHPPRSLHPPHQGHQANQAPQRLRWLPWLQTIGAALAPVAQQGGGSFSVRNGIVRVTATRYDCLMKIFLLDSISQLTAEASGQIVVSGSHGGMSSARLALAHPPTLIIFNDAGLGMDEAGVAGLHILQDEGIAACAVSHMSARIGNAQSTLNLGLITSINDVARSARIQIGMTTQQAIDTYQLYR